MAHKLSDTIPTTLVYIGAKKSWLDERIERMTDDEERDERAAAVAWWAARAVPEPPAEPRVPLYYFDDEGDEV